MEATAVLRRDHDAMRDLLAQLSSALGEDERTRTLFRALKDELVRHTRVEEELFYPALLRVRSPETRERVRDALGHHQALDALVAEMDQTEPEDPRYADRLAVLRESVERHIEGEEGALFALARIHLTDDRLLALGDRMEMRRGSY